MAGKIGFTILFLIALLLVFPLCVSSEPEDFLQPHSMFARSMKDSYIPDPVNPQGGNHSPEGESGHLEWLERIRYAIIIEEDEKPDVYFETTQPFFQDSEKINTFFFQPRLSFHKDLGTYNFGIGYRRLLFDKQLLLGLNTFFDYQNRNNHSRLGVGGEAFTRFLEFRMNGYFALSQRRMIDQNKDYKYYERVVPGMDGSIGGQIPYIPWLKAFFGGYWYDYRISKDKQGWELRIEAKPIKFMTINIGAYKDTKMRGEDPTWRIDMVTSIPLHGFSIKELFANLCIPSQPYPAKDLTKLTLIRVERNNKIEVESYAVCKNSGLTVEIGRQ